MAIELTDELIGLERKAEAERVKAQTGPHSAEAWRPWLDAAITAHAAATGQNRVEVEAELKRVVRHPEGADG